MQLLLTVQSENSKNKFAHNIAHKMVLIIRYLMVKVQSFDKKPLPYIYYKTT
jgi:hypothetical protein